MQFLEKIFSVACVLWMDKKMSLFCSYNQSNINFKKCFYNDFRNSLLKRPNINNNKINKDKCDLFVPKKKKKKNKKHVIL